MPLSMTEKVFQNQEELCDSGKSPLEILGAEKQPAIGACL